MHPIVEKLAQGLVVSCQSSPDDGPLYGSAAMAAMAQVAELGGAVGIRANGVADIAAIRQVVKLPIIGIDKQFFEGLGIRITPSLEAARRIVQAGADLVALDATHRAEAEGRIPAADLIRQVRDTLNVPVMADISTLEEGIAAADAGADIVATTMSGYTPYSPALKTPDFDLIQQLVKAVRVPVIAEGRIASPKDARCVLELGGYAVVVGSMITKPRWIVEKYVAALTAYRQTNQRTILAADIGGTKIAVSVVQNNTEILYRAEVPTLADEGGAAVLERLIKALQVALTAYPDCQAIGISTTGEVDAAGRIAYSTGFMPGWMGVPVQERVAASLGLPVVVENDAQAATVGEALYGAGQGFPSVLGITVGTGVGGGLVINREVYAGASGAALTMGHITVEPEGRLCTCGARGCLESYVSGSALASDYNARVPAERRLETGKDVMLAAQRGDPDASAAIRVAGEWLGKGLAYALNLLNPALVVIGGGVVQIGQPFLDSVQSSVKQHAYPTVRDTPLVIASLGTDAGLIGAAVLARQYLAEQ